MSSEPPLPLRQRFRLSRFFRGENPVAGPITLNQRRIFILPTRRGLGFALLIVLLLLIAFVHNNNLAYMLGFLLASIFFVTILHSFRSLNGLVIQPGFNPPVFAGEMASFHFNVHNPSSHWRYALEITLQESQTFNLEPEQSQALALPVASRQRGCFHCGTVTLASRYPLGLFRAWSPLRFDSAVLVYPRPLTESRPFPENSAEVGKTGQQPQSGEEFYGLKAYQVGDSIRQIHWKSFAKGREIQSKQYAGVASLELWLDYANTPGHDVEARLSQLCRWVIEAERAGLKYGLQMPGGRLEPNWGTKHYHACLQVLARF